MLSNDDLLLHGGVQPCLLTPNIINSLSMLLKPHIVPRKIRLLCINSNVGLDICFIIYRAT